MKPATDFRRRAGGRAAQIGGVDQVTHARMAGSPDATQDVEDSQSIMPASSIGLASSSDLSRIGLEIAINRTAIVEP
ncbi:hypothetical protein [Thiocapsa sp.]|uniref:hypothetical protein n=1 Tax=Thiocapsa sp. TaxID=2024551 RepID=UPI00359357EA